MPAVFYCRFLNLFMDFFKRFTNIGGDFRGNLLQKLYILQQILFNLFKASYKKRQVYYGDRNI